MSQQEMHYGDSAHQQAEQNYATYDGLPPQSQSQPPFGIPYGQKLPPPSQHQIPTPGQRLALAIVSLAMLMFMIFGLIIIDIAAHINGPAMAGFIFVIILFFTAVVVVNALFNRNY